jgi:tetratricopeptide (TPR) repeat protein
MRSAVLAGLALAAVLLAGWSTTVTAQSGRISGIVRDETGEPLKGATVRAENPVGVPKSFTSSTDDKGRFNIIGLRPGNWTLTAEAPGFDSQAASLRLQAQGMPTRPLLFTLAKSFGGPMTVLGSVAPKDLQASLAEADQLFQNQQWAEALSAYQDILARTPALSSINLQLAAVFREQHDFDAAVRAYQTLLDAEPGNPKAVVGLASTRLEQGDADAAEALLQKVAAANGQDREVLYALGNIRASRGDVAGAAEWYRKASEADPFWGKPIYELGRLAMNGGDRAAALTFMRKVVETDPLSPEAAQAKAVLAEIQP